jgi:hypothetical protein
MTHSPKRRDGDRSVISNQLEAEMSLLPVAAGFSLDALDAAESADSYLAPFDIAELNSACAQGLPGAESIDVPRVLQWLDEAAERVNSETRRHWHRFNASPGTYRNSPGYFCCYYLLQVLQEDFGVRYNPERVRDPTFQDPSCHAPDFRDSRDLFIHGIIDGQGGTCASMPVLYVAVGRRSGYPLKLVQSRGHLFFRWDDPHGERFGVPEQINIEGTGDGIGSYPDDHYRTWPEPWTEADHAGGWYLRSMTPTEELAAFLSNRGECLTDNGRIAEAIRAYQYVRRIVPHDLRYAGQLGKLMHRWQREMIAVQRMLEHADALSKPSVAQAGAAPTGSPPHSAACQCFHCRQAKAASNHPQSFGHPPQCRCPLCQQTPASTPWRPPMGFGPRQNPTL